MEGGFKMFARHNPQVVGFSLQVDRNFQPAFLIRMVIVSQNLICTLCATLCHPKSKFKINLHIYMNQKSKKNHSQLTVEYMIFIM